jgi:transcriptional regulator with PAS, ATPase and Fis domain
MIPPLRTRGRDVVVLAKHFVELYSDKYSKSGFKLEDSFIQKLCDYPFPGNVRELQYALERAVIMAETSILNEDDFKLETVEKNAILKVIEKNNGNISKSAKILGITRTALYRRLNKYGL